LGVEFDGCAPEEDFGIAGADVPPVAGAPAGGLVGGLAEAVEIELQGFAAGAAGAVGLGASFGAGVPSHFF